MKWRIEVFLNCSREELFSTLQELERRGCVVDPSNSIRQDSPEDELRATFLVPDHKYSEFINAHEIKSWISKELVK